MGYRQFYQSTLIFFILGNMPVLIKTSSSRELIHFLLAFLASAGGELITISWASNNSDGQYKAFIIPVGTIK